MLKKFLLGLVSFYQKAISPHTIGACRFRPTCSEYMRIALERYGAFKGLWLGIKRILRCHPFSSGGFDPVPEAPETTIRRK